MKLIVIFALFLVACQHDPVSVYQTDNHSMPVELLFEHEGCKVYRFSDSGRAHYYVRCTDGTSYTSQEVPQGKTSVPEEIPTVRCLKNDQ